MNTNKGYHRQPHTHPGQIKGGTARAAILIANKDEWAQFRKFLAMDRLPIQQFLRRAMLDYVASCFEFYKEMNAEEKENGNSS